MTRTLPPVVRVFISSTFADMENERNYFNQVLAPQLTRLCEKRGVSFFSVDLRWGITKEEQINGEVLPICLREIDKCRPFFIGILGNRYGSTLETVTDALAASFPWLKNHAGKSITELEMLYGVLDGTNEHQDTDCAFFFREDVLSQQYYATEESEEGIKKLDALKQAILERKDIPHFSYGSLEEFGEQLLTSFENWMNQEFPTAVSVKMARREWYNNELQRDYYEIPSMEHFLDHYLQNSRSALLIYGEGRRGKTAFLSNWAGKQTNTILINCNADEEFRYWPAIAHEIIKRMTRIDPTCGMPEYKAKATLMFKMASRFKGGSSEESSIYYVTDEERESFRKGFVQWLGNLTISKPVNIVINDIQAIRDKRSYYLSWLPAKLPENVHLICTANEAEICENAGNIGWNCMEMPLCDNQFVVDFLHTYMHNYGKNLSVAQKENLYHSKLLQYPGYLKFIMKFLIVYGSFENLDYLTKTIGELQDISKVYQFVLEYITAELPEKEAVYDVLGFAYYTSLGLQEEECYSLVSKLVPVNALIWSNVRVVLEQFEAVSGEYWKLENRDVSAMIASLPIHHAKINELLGNHFMEALSAGEREENLTCIKTNTEYAKAVLEQYTLAKNWKLLSDALLSEPILHYLIKVDWTRVRVAWMKVLLYSEIDVESKLAAFAKEMVTKNAEVAYQLSSLLFDLEMYSLLEELEKLLGRKPLSEMRYRGSARFSEEFIERYNRIVELKRKRNYRGVYLETKAWLENQEDIRPEELCLLYSIKEESDMNLRLYEEAIETSGKGYTLAIRSMDMENIMSSLIARGNCQMQFGNYEEAKKNFKYVQKLALEEGFLREYLSTKNLEGMCLYREGKYEEALGQFDFCIRVWGQVKNAFEMITCRINKVNVHRLQEQNELFLAESKDLYEYIVELQDEKLDRHRLMALDDVGQGEMLAGNLEAAEKSFLQIIEECQAKGHDYALENSCHNLMQLYKKQNLMLKEAEICKILLEYYFSTRRYKDLVERLRDEVERLKLCKYDTYAAELYGMWEQRFMQIPNGKAIFELQETYHSDDVRMTQIQEEMVVAKSADDKTRQGVLLQEKAEKLAGLNPKECTDTYLEAAKCFLECEEKERSRMCAVRGVSNIFLGEKNYDEERRKAFYPYLEEIDMQVIKLWMETDKLRRKTGFSVFKQTMSVSESIERVAAIREESKLVYPCIYDFLKELLEEADAAVMTRIVENVKDLTFFDRLVNDMIVTYEQMYGSALHDLTKSYAGRNADKMVEFFERCVAFFAPLHKETSAMLAGNIALIFRRREEKEKTYRYHEISRKGYMELGKERDSFIEAMNLATAYRDFGELEKAVELLRKTLQELEHTEHKELQGAVAGNLASYLTRLNKNHEYNDEILACFRMEEDYFRNAGEKRGYVISLANQIMFYLDNGEQYLEQLVMKYQEAKGIVEKYGIREFMQPLQQMGASIERLLRNANSGSAPASPQNEEDVLVIVKDFFEKDEKFEFVDAKVEEQALMVNAKLREENSGANARLMINIPLRMPQNWDVVFAMQPQLAINPNYDRDIYQYVFWWNLQQDYGLRMGDNHVVYVRKEYNVSDSTWMHKEFNRDVKLWMADLMNMMLIALGAMDVDDVREEKKKVVEKLNGE